MVSVLPVRVCKSCSITTYVVGVGRLDVDIPEQVVIGGWTFGRRTSAQYRGKHVLHACSVALVEVMREYRGFNVDVNDNIGY